MPREEEEYEVEEEERGDVIKWFYVTRKKDGKQFTVSVNYSATTDSTTITAFDTAHKKEQKEIEETVRKYLVPKEEQEIDISKFKEELEWAEKIYEEDRTDPWANGYRNALRTILKEGDERKWKETKRT